MRVMAMILLLSSLCVGSESISGIWGLDRHKNTKAVSRPIAVQIEQTADYLNILRIIATSQGKYVENIWLNAADIRSTPTNTRLTIPGSMEIWTLRRSGELIIKRRISGQRNERFVLHHAREVFPFAQEGVAK